MSLEPQTHILIIETSRHETLITVLNQPGYQVKSVTHYDDVVALATWPDVILLAVERLAVWEEWLKAHPALREIPFLVVLTAEITPDKAQCFAAGAVDYLPFPLAEAEVLARVKTHATMRQLQRQVSQLHAQLAQTNWQYQRMVSVVEHATDGIVITDRKGRIEYVNRAFEQASGYSQAEALGQTPRILKSGVHSLDFYRNLWQTINAGQSFRAEFTNRRKNGELYQYENIITPIRDDSGKVTHFMALGRDISDRKQAEAMLQQVHQRIQDELAFARRIQQGLLPPPRPDWTELDVICYNMPARQVGGDLYAYKAFKQELRSSDVVLPYVVTPDHYALAVGDISGKGMPAALLMAVSLVMFQAFARHTLRPSRLLNHLDRAMMPYTKTTQQNCAMVYLEITPPSPASPGLLQIANAGCIAPIIKRVDGSVKWLEVGGIPLGAGLGVQLGYQEIAHEVVAGDMIVLMSDGVVEATNNEGQMLSFDGFTRLIQDAPTATAEAMLDYLKIGIVTFLAGAEPHDDITLVVIRI